MTHTCVFHLALALVSLLQINALHPLLCWIRCQVWSKYENVVEVREFEMYKILCYAIRYRLIFFSTFRCRWKGSTYRLIWKEFLIYTAVYLTISVVYDFVLDDVSKKYRLSLIVIVVLLCSLSAVVYF